MNPETSAPAGAFSLPISRREAVRRVVLMMGLATVGSHVLLRGASLADTKTADFTDADRALLDEIGDTILPATKIPGAKATQIGAFMTMMVRDCYSPEEEAAFRKGIASIDAAARDKFGRGFTACAPADRTTLLQGFDRAAREAAGIEPRHFFGMVKDLTILGYFSSEIGCNQAVRYIGVPGAFHGDIPYKKGDPAWFE
ncbi:MAG TPA: gluconate 2-dehydrogenase subunit 3 family protein [Candidatus Didemnitutus sp.]|nr:gluconate 2-dehydrogenase subunit 3 family protein [Candidatus Didemnitutus sp.]